MHWLVRQQEVLKPLTSHAPLVQPQQYTLMCATIQYAVTSSLTSSTSWKEIKPRSKSSCSKNTLGFWIQILVIFASVTSVSSTSWLSWAKVNTFDASSMALTSASFLKCGTAAQMAFPGLPGVAFVVGGSLCSATTSIVSDVVRPEDQEHQSILRDTWYGAPIAAVTTSGMSSLKDVPEWLTKMTMKRIASKVVCELGPNAVMDTIYDDLRKETEETEPSVLTKWTSHFASSLCNGAVSTTLNSLESHINARNQDSHVSGDETNTKYQEYLKKREASGDTRKPVSFEKYKKLADMRAMKAMKKQALYKRMEKARLAKASNLAINPPSTKVSKTRVDSPISKDETTNVDNSGDNTFQIFVKGIDGKTTALKVSADTKVSDLVEQIGPELYISYGLQTLQAGDSRTLADLNIEREANLLTSARLKGGGYSYKRYETELEYHRKKLVPYHRHYVKPHYYNTRDELDQRMEFAGLMEHVINERFKHLKVRRVDGDYVRIFDDLLNVFEDRSMVEHRYAIDGFLLKQFNENLRELGSLMNSFGTLPDQDEFRYFQDVYKKFDRWVNEVDYNTEIFMKDYISRKFTDFYQYYDAYNQLILFLDGFRKPYFSNPHHAEYHVIGDNQ